MLLIKNATYSFHCKLVIYLSIDMYIRYELQLKLFEFDILLIYVEFLHIFTYFLKINLVSS